MIGESELTEVMDAIYFAPHRKNGWRDCLDLINHRCSGEVTQLLMLDKGSQQPIACYQSRSAGNPDPVDGNTPSSCRVRYEVGSVRVELVVLRPAQNGVWHPDERACIETLVPHIARAMRQEEASRMLTDRQAAIHRQKQGALLLLDGQQHVAFMSNEAESLLERNSAISLEAGRLRLVQRKKQQELDNLMLRCFENTASGMVNLDADGPDGVRLLVSTVQRREEKLFPSNGLLAVFVVGGESEEKNGEKVIGKWLGLTDSESRVASLIAQGLRPADIAKDIHLSVHTVRHHIKSIYRKTGVHSQSQLTALVLNLPT